MTAEERFKRLERENRWMKLGGGALVLGLLVVLFGGAGQDQEKPKVLDEVRAKKIALVDEASRERIVLELVKNAGGRGPNIRMKDEDGTTCFLVRRNLSDQGSGTRLELRDLKGRAEVSMCAISPLKILPGSSPTPWGTAGFSMKEGGNECFTAGGCAGRGYAQVSDRNGGSIKLLCCPDPPDHALMIHPRRLGAKANWQVELGVGLDGDAKLLLRKESGDDGVNLSSTRAGTGVAADGKSK